MNIKIKNKSWEQTEKPTIKFWSRYNLKNRKMNNNQLKGIGFIIGGILSIIIIPRILSILGLFMIAYYLQSYYIIYIIALILVASGLKLLITDNKKMEEEDEPKSFGSNQNNNFANTNKVVNISLTGGIIGLLANSPQNALNRRIKKENANGWKVIQIIPAASGNIFLIILRLIILFITFFLYTPTNGYYLVMERIDNSNKLKNSSDGVIDTIQKTIDPKKNNKIEKRF